MTDTTYSVFPITLAHPGFRKSQPIPIPGTEIYGKDGSVIRRDFRGTPEMNAPVTVMNETEEEYYRAQGYERAGKVDPAAWAQEHSSAPEDTYVPSEYPKWVKFEGQDFLAETVADDPTANESARTAAVEAREAHIKEVGGTPSPPAAEAEAAHLRDMLAALEKRLADMEANAAIQAIETSPAATTSAAVQAVEAVEDQAADAAKRGPGRPRKEA